MHPVVLVVVTALAAAGLDVMRDGNENMPASGRTVFNKKHGLRYDPVGGNDEDDAGFPYVNVHYITPFRDYAQEKQDAEAAAEHNLRAADERDQALRLRYWQDRTNVKLATASVNSAIISRTRLDELNFVAGKYVVKVREKAATAHNRLSAFQFLQARVEKRRAAFAKKFKKFAFRLRAELAAGTDTPERLALRLATAN